MRSSKIDIIVQENAGSHSQKKGENKRKKRIRVTDTDRNVDEVHQPHNPLLIRCSSSEGKVNKKKQKRQELIPMTTTITKHISITKTITFTTPPEDPESEVCIYLCLQKASDPNGHWYRWCKIDLMSQSSEPKSKSKPMFLPTISYMPISTPTRFCVVASSDCGPFSLKKHKKLVYAVGGLYVGKEKKKKNGDEEDNAKKHKKCGNPFSAKAFVCDFGSKSLTWEELPPMSSPKEIHCGVVSPFDGKLYAYGNNVDCAGEGEVFDPASRSWTSCPPPGIASSVRIKDHTFDKEQNELIVFTSSNLVYALKLTTLLWRRSVHKLGLAPCSNEFMSSYVVVGNIIYKYHLGELYALDKTCPPLSFELVRGLAKKVDPYMRNRDCMRKSYLSYLGKGKFALVWHGHGPSFGAPKNRDAIYISCLTFWVGLCNPSNRRCVIIDQRQQYFADGHFLHDCVAL